ncbi:hypothetical protein ACFWAN_45485, partial [Streptomyces mirabilis]
MARRAGCPGRAVAPTYGRTPPAGRSGPTATFDLEVGLFVYNAGGDDRSVAFLDKDLGSHLELVHRNCLGPLEAAYRDYVAANGTSTADLRTGDRLTVRQLLYATMLP